MSWNLGVIFDQNLSFDEHIKLVSRTAFFHLCNIAKYTSLLPEPKLAAGSTVTLSTFKIRLKTLLSDKAYS